MSNEGRPIVIRRARKGAHEFHGGNWKIAYADFVTAMMAFFLLMWLLGSTTTGDLQGIAEYFRTPLKVALQGGSGAGDASSVIKGGGKDLTRSWGQVQMSELPTKKRNINLKAAQAEVDRVETERLRLLKGRLEAAIDASPALNAFRQQLRLDLTSDGLRVQIVDEQNRPMFDTGSDKLKDYARTILRELGPTLDSVPNKITLSGHTDSAPYASGERGYSNWELSADRANSARRELIASGISEAKIMRVVGLGSAVMLDAKDPLDPINRRISITVMNKQAEEHILGETGTAVSSPAQKHEDAGAAQ